MDVLEKKSNKNIKKFVAIWSLTIVICISFVYMGVVNIFSSDNIGTKSYKSEIINQSFNTLKCPDNYAKISLDDSYSCVLISSQKVKPSYFFCPSGYEEEIIEESVTCAITDEAGTISYIEAEATCPSGYNQQKEKNESVTCVINGAEYKLPEYLCAMGYQAKENNNYVKCVK